MPRQVKASERRVNIMVTASNRVVSWLYAEAERKGTTPNKIITEQLDMMYEVAHQTCPLCGRISDCNYKLGKGLCIDEAGKPLPLKL